MKTVQLIIYRSILFGSLLTFFIAILFTENDDTAFFGLLITSLFCFITAAVLDDLYHITALN